MDGEQVLQAAVDAYRLALGDRLLAAYALGSLAHGGFSELVSDIDLGLIIRDPLRAGDPDCIEEIADREKRRGSPLHARLSVFWSTPAALRGERGGGRFPPLDRLDLIESGRLLTGSDDVRLGLPRPSTEELVVAGSRFALDFLAGIRTSADRTAHGLGSLRPAGEDAVEEISCPELLIGNGVRRVTKLVLFPVRFIYTAETAQVGTNFEAVAHFLRRGGAPSTELVSAALRWRTDPPPDAQAVELLREQLVPLYLHYIDDHIARLRSYGRGELVAAFERWRELVAAARRGSGAIATTAAAGQRPASPQARSARRGVR